MKKYLMLILVALAIGFQSCNNHDDLWDAIDDLKSRVQALETQVKALNGNVEALKTFYGGATISKVERVDGKYVLTLTNGEKIELVQGSQAQAVIPVIGIDSKGFWQVSYDGGKNYTSLNVSAAAQDGVTPQFRIDESTGYWQISYDGGKNFTNVTDTAGKPVKAIGTGTVTDKFFSEVKVQNGNFYVKLLDGTELNVPIVSDFFCRIVTTTAGAQTFDAGATRRFEVQIKGVESTVVTAPLGWTARLTEVVGEKAELIVTAPAAGTRATADSSKDVSILATSGVYACIAKIQVESSGVAPVVPTISIAQSTTLVPTTTTLTFDVTLSENADTWKYICQKSTETAPDAAKILASGSAGVGTSLTVTGLEAETAYTVYVVALAGELQSTVAQVEIKTAAVQVDPNDYYTAGVVINGVRYDSKSDGAQLLTETTAIANGEKNLYFIDPKDASVAITLAGKGTSGFSDLVVIGRHAGTKPLVKLTDYVSMNGTGGGLIFKNVKLDATSVANYMVNVNGTGAFDHLIFEDCTIETAPDKAFGYFSTAASVTKFILRNNKIHMNVSATGKTGLHVLGLAATFLIAKTSEITLANNVIYANSPITGGLINGANTTYNPDMVVNVTNNTIINYLGVNAYVVINNAATANLSKNIMWCETFTATSYLFRMNANLNHVVLTLDNCIYGGGSWVSIQGSNMPNNFTSSPAVTKADTDPFTGGTFELSTGTFIPATAYADYGSTLK